MIIYYLLMRIREVASEDGNADAKLAHIEGMISAFRAGRRKNVEAA